MNATCCFILCKKNYHTDERLLFFQDQQIADLRSLIKKYRKLEAIIALQSQGPKGELLNGVWKTVNRIY